MTTKFILKRSLLLIASLFFKLIILAQEPVYIQFTEENGLPSNNVYYSLQDSKGFIWFATDKGVVRYDGVRFQAFTTSDGLADNECFDIYEDKQHRIWFASYNGEPSFYFEGRFYNKNTTTFLSKLNFKGPGLKFMEDVNGDLYYLTFKEVFRLRGSQFSSIHKSSILYSSLVKDNKSKVYALHQTLKGKAYLSNLSDNKTEELKEFNSLLRLNTKAIILKNKLCFPYENKLQSYDLKTKKIALIKKLHEGNMIQYFNKINGQYWIGTNGGFSNGETKNGNLFLPEKSVSSIFKDAEKNIWITTLNCGVFQIINPEVKCYNFSSDLGFDNCQSVFRFKNGVIGVGSANFKYAFIQNGKAKSYSSPKRAGTGVIKRIVRYKNNYYLSTGTSLIKLNDKFKIIRDISSATKDFIIDDQGKLYLVGGSSLIRANPNKFFESKDKLQFEEEVELKATGLYKTPNKEIYVFGLFGVLKYDKGKLFKLAESEYLSKNIVGVLQGNHGIFWVASSIYGLIAIYKGKVYCFDENDGISSVYVTSITQGKDNDLWIGTNKGLTKVNYEIVNGKPIVSCKKYDRSNGIASEMINNIMYYHDSLWLATSKGLCVLKESSLTFNKNKPLLYLSEFYANEKKLGSNTRFKFRPDQNRLKIIFTGISYFSLGKISYKYRLKGQQENWNYSSSGQIEYPSLNPGKYHLQIMAIDAFGKSSNVKNVYFAIQPYFYQTWTFIFCLILMLIILIFALVNYRFKKIRDKHLLEDQIFRLEHENLKVEHKKTKLLKEYLELEQKALLLQMNPHFIFNSINTIQGLYKKDVERGDEYLVKFSNMLRQILEYSKCKTISLDQEIMFLSNYLDINKLRFEKEFEYKIDIDPSIIRNQLAISPMIIQPFVENSLIHGIQGITSHGIIDLLFYISEPYLICEITDNGIGREKAKERSKYRVHASLGMEITEKRLKIFNNEEQELALQIIDLYDDQGLACGTKVIISIVYEDFYS